MKRLGKPTKTKSAKEVVMKRNIVYAGLVLATICSASLLPLQAHAAQCSLASVSGNWAYTYNGTVFVPNPLPVAAVGHAHLDSSGNVAGTQTHTLAGQTEVEAISGTYTVNKDCTGSMTVNVSLNGQLLRTATLNVAYDTDVNHARMIFTSLTLADGTTLPAVITADVNRVATKN
jgi:hypothetical protein